MSGSKKRGLSSIVHRDGLNPVQELDAANSPVANLLTGLGLDEFFTRTDAKGARHILPDALGSAIALTDPAGAVVKRYAYEPYGETSTTGEANANPFQYTGPENDGTGLYYYRARYYDPGLKRFVSEDPIGLAGGINTYAYVGGDPLTHSDPYGLWTWPSPSDVFSYWSEVAGAARDFYGTYTDMIDAGRTMVQQFGPGGAAGADKYFHCKANCQAAQRGPGGEDFACVASNAKEWRDQNWKGYPPSDSAADQRANRYGRDQGAVNRSTPCSVICNQ